MAEENDTESVDKNDNDNLKDLRRAAEEGRKATREAELARKELLFVKAGVDTDSKLGQLLFKSYDGELTVDAIKAEASELGAVASPAAPKAPVVGDDERQQGRERQDLASESGSPAALTEDHPNVVARKAFNDAMEAGTARDAAGAAAIKVIMEAANRGDSRVIIP